jgi:hypothetical protein
MCEERDEFSWEDGAFVFGGNQYELMHHSDEY